MSSGVHHDHYWARGDFDRGSSSMRKPAVQPFPAFVQPTHLGRLAFQVAQHGSQDEFENIRKGHAGVAEALSNSGPDKIIALAKMGAQGVCYKLPSCVPHPPIFSSAGIPIPDPTMFAPTPAACLGMGGQSFRVHGFAPGNGYAAMGVVGKCLTLGAPEVDGWHAAQEAHHLADYASDPSQAHALNRLGFERTRDPARAASQRASKPGPWQLDEDHQQAADPSVVDVAMDSPATDPLGLSSEAELVSPYSGRPGAAAEGLPAPVGSPSFGGGPAAFESADVDCGPAHLL
eukprot:tig00000981_g5866.t1